MSPLEGRSPRSVSAIGAQGRADEFFKPHGRPSNAHPDETTYLKASKSPAPKVRALIREARRDRSRQLPALRVDIDPSSAR